jgi:hypothetical protein
MPSPFNQERLANGPGLEGSMPFTVVQRHCPPLESSGSTCQSPSPMILNDPIEAAVIQDLIICLDCRSAIDMLAFSIMSNHFHVVMHNRIDLE